MQGFTKCDDCSTMVQVDLAEIEIRQGAYVLCDKCAYIQFGIKKEGVNNKIVYVTVIDYYDGMILQNRTAHTVPEGSDVLSIALEFAEQVSKENDCSVKFSIYLS